MDTVPIAPMPRSPGAAGGTSLTPRPDEPLRLVAQALEARFLSEMLKSSGLGRTPGAFGGGVGEDQFASFLRDEQAKLLAARGGIGLAETIFRSLAAGGRNGS